MLLPSLRRAMGCRQNQQSTGHVLLATFRDYLLFVGLTKTQLQRIYPGEHAPLWCEQVKLWCLCCPFRGVTERPSAEVPLPELLP